MNVGLVNQFKIPSNFRLIFFPLIFIGERLSSQESNNRTTWRREFKRLLILNFPFNKNLIKPSAGICGQSYEHLCAVIYDASGYGKTFSLPLDLVNMFKCLLTIC